MWKEVPPTRKKEVLSSHLVESSRPSLTTVRLEVHFSFKLLCVNSPPSSLRERKNRSIHGQRRCGTRVTVLSTTSELQAYLNTVTNITYSLNAVIYYFYYSYNFCQATVRPF